MRDNCQRAGVIMEWSEGIKGRFPDWGTDAALERWPEVRERLHVGQNVHGMVIARAPFGVWVDIDVGQPALLEVPEMHGAKERRITFEDYPVVGEEIEARIIGLGDRGQIALTQHPFSE